jgi:uncharacterized protein YfiM (DUF2279 family)
MSPSARPPLAVLVVLLSSQAAPAAPLRDGWFDQDKRKHFVISLGLAAGGYGAGAVLSRERHVRLITGAGLALGVGLGKEIHDRRQGRLFSFKDLAWDAAGTAAGLGLAWLLDTLLWPERAPAATWASERTGRRGWEQGGCAQHGEGARRTHLLLVCTTVRSVLTETRE